MRIATLEDRAWIERVCNHPLVRMWTERDGASPCSGLQWVTAPNFSVVGEEGCFLARHLDPGRYAIHTNLLPDFRGEHAIRASEEALDIAFFEADAMELVTMVPGTIPQARLLARHMGFEHRFTRDSVWPVEGALYPLGFYAMTIDDWIMQGRCTQAGEVFHHRLHDELGGVAHRRDVTHDMYVGAVVEMIKRGCAHKAIAVYNRWARFGLYDPVQIISESPLRIDIRQCVIKVEEGQFTIEEAFHA